MARLVFDDPERRNAVSLEMWPTVEQALVEFATDAAIRVVVSTGAGDWGIAFEASLRSHSSPVT